MYRRRLLRLLLLLLLLRQLLLEEGTDECDDCVAATHRAASDA